VTDLQEKIRSRKARVGVIGLGYVGLPLAVEFARAGLDVTGFDVDSRRVEDVNQGRSYIVDMSDGEMREILGSGRLRATADFSRLADMDTINICVPTPLRKTKDPDLTYIVSAVRSIREHLRRGQLVILESTTYPGTTEEVVQPILEESGLRAGRDFYLAFSPERIDPGNPNFNTRNIPKVVGGHSPECAAVARTLYEQCIETVVPVSSTRVAEMVKLLENTFRSVNIGLVNELAQMSQRLGIDVWEVIDAAKTKPFGFMAFYPGPGLGGHCIPVDPYYLSWKARMHDFEPRFIELAGIVNESMPRFVVERITEALNRQSKSVRDSKIHLVGIAYKRGVNDVRESPALNVLKLLFEKGAILSYSDPYVPKLREEGLELSSVPLEATLSNGCDCAVILTDHTEFDYGFIARNARAVVDTRNALRAYDGDNIVRL
jgi:UDP-N-acetyl-D-glucosamine dehydrogenase